MMSKDRYIECIQQIKDENKNSLEICILLLRITGNIIQHPKESKYRQLRILNKMVMEKLLPASGAMQCLFEMGFAEDGEFLRHNLEGGLTSVNRVHIELLKLQHDLISAKTAAQPQLNISNKAQAEFKQRLINCYGSVKSHEDIGAQMTALAYIPADSLRANIPEQEDMNDVVLYRLVEWFKEDFFTWVSNAPCDVCQGDTIRSQEPGIATEEEALYGASRVELYICRTCDGRVTRFPRYNDAVYLLTTRRGRCGEWANCFALCLRAMGYNTRYVTDWSDHVWNEAYSKKQSRWLHCDPCENCVDSPLIYETGWNKKIDYVFAFSYYEIKDVTWRYTNNSNATKNNRTLLSEDWIRALCKALNNVHATEQMKYKSIMMSEAVELLGYTLVTRDTTQQTSSRKSGSTDWRMKHADANYTFVPTSEELKDNKLEVEYISASDEYIRRGKASNSWSSLVNKSSGIVRKVEKDWKKTYLARASNENAVISWNFEFKECGRTLDSLEVNLLGEVFESGIIRREVLFHRDGATTTTIMQSDKQTFKDNKGSDGITINVYLSEGTGECAWQHTQLFRTNSQDFITKSLFIKILLQS